MQAMWHLQVNFLGAWWLGPAPRQWCRRALVCLKLWSVPTRIAALAKGSMPLPAPEVSGDPGAARGRIPLTCGGAAICSPQTFGAVSLLRKHLMPLQGCTTSSARWLCTQNPSIPGTLPSGASAATGALHREPPVCANTVTQSQNTQVGCWGDPDAFGYLGTLFPPALLPSALLLR